MCPFNFEYRDTIAALVRESPHLAQVFGKAPAAVHLRRRDLDDRFRGSTLEDIVQVFVFNFGF
jgi:hypothetical protein